MKRAEIVAAARETLGTPYGSQGRIAGRALDCAGVPVYVAKKLGVPLDFAGYGAVLTPIEVKAVLERHLERIPVTDIQVGDVAWLRVKVEPKHLAIVGDYKYGGLSLIHANNGSGLDKVVEHRLDDQWRGRIAAAWRYPGVEA